MLAAVDDPVVAVGPGVALHAAHVGAGAGLGHRQRVELLAAHRRQQVLLALRLVAGLQDAGRAAEEHRERVRRAAELALEQREVDVAETAAAELLGDVGGEVAGLDALVANRVAELERHLAGFLDFGLVRVDFLLDELAHGVDDHLLLEAQSEMQHEDSPRFSSSRGARGRRPGFLAMTFTSRRHWQPRVSWPHSGRGSCRRPSRCP